MYFLYYFDGCTVVFQHLLESRNRTLPQEWEFFSVKNVVLKDL